MLSKLVVLFGAVMSMFLFFLGKQSEKNKNVKRAVKSVKKAKKVQDDIDTMSRNDKRKRMRNKYSRSRKPKS